MVTTYREDVMDKLISPKDANSYSLAALSAQFDKELSEQYKSRIKDFDQKIFELYLEWAKRVERHGF